MWHQRTAWTCWSCCRLPDLQQPRHKHLLCQGWQGRGCLWPGWPAPPSQHQCPQAMAWASRWLSPGWHKELVSKKKRSGTVPCSGDYYPLVTQVSCPRFVSQWTCWGGICPFTPVIDDKLNTLAPVLNPGDSTSERPPMEPVPLIPSGICYPANSQSTPPSTLPEHVNEDVRQCQSLAEAEADSTHCSSLIHPGGHSSTETIRWLRHDWPVVNPRWLMDHLLVTQMKRDGIQKEVLNPLTRDWDNTDWPALPWVLLALFEDWSDFWCLAVLRHLSWSPQVIAHEI